MRRLVPVEVTMEKELSDYYEICNISNKTMDIEWLIDEVLLYTGWTWDGVYGRSRKKDLILKRGIIDLIANCNNITYSGCARFTSRDHSTVMNSVKQIEDILDTDREARNLLREIMEALKFKLKMEKGGK